MKSNFIAITRIIEQLYRILSPRQRRQAVYVCFTMMLTSFLELLGVSLVYSFLNIVLNIDKSKELWYISWIYVFSPQIDYRIVIVIIGIGIMGLFLIKNALALFFAFLQYKFSSELQRDVSTLMLSSYMMRPFEYFINHNSADLFRGVINDPESVYFELLNIFQMLGEFFTIFVLGTFLMITSWEIALGAIVLAVACFWGIVLTQKKRLKIAGKENRKASMQRNQYCLQALNGIKEITVSNRREMFVNQFRNAADRYSKTSLFYSFVATSPDRIIEGVCVSGLMGIICLRIVWGVDLATFIPVLGAFAVGAFRILPSISKITSRVNSIVFYQSGLQHCYDNIVDAKKYRAEKSDNRRNSSEKTQLDKFRSKLVIKDLSWSYTNSNKLILNNVSLTINKGESIALLGASGAGKTTLADIILGLLEPKVGRIEIDGTDIFSIPKDWSRIIGYVPQNIYLIDDSIRANVAFGIPKEDISNDKVVDALRRAQLYGFVDELPDGIDTIVGERGVKLSGGQRQRIAIARALYENPEILVLDEATSALDNETESAVMESIEALHGDKTLIIVAHRLSTIKNCDRFFEIVDGVSVERQRHEIDFTSK